MEADVALIDAVRTSLQQQVRTALECAGITEPASLLECPRCGDRIIALDVPVSYGFDAAERICRPCRAQIDLTAEQDADLGGEG